MTAAVPRPSKRTFRRLAYSTVTTALVAAAFQAGRRTRPEQPPVAQKVEKDEPPAPAAPSRRPRGRVLLAVSVLVITAGTVAAVVGELDGYACLSNPVIAADPRPTGVQGMTRVPLLTRLPYRGPRVAAGDAVKIRQPYPSMEWQREVTVRGVDDVRPATNLQPSAGRRLVSVTASEHNISRRNLNLLNMEKVWLCDADGTWYEHDAEMTKTLKVAAGGVGYDPGMRVDHRVVFQIFEHARPHRVRIGKESTDPASGDWMVG
ncbi:hypothetical protein Q0Z83_020950 [Actinoplanes sichuanensis]|uniref:Uncharacterized protein n=1 Tax=Actinoplanes sichuanensis TaxID=512349 RepID=A0ABW4AJ42_9ACTN|nr:hypothetical protein [Actinoplanes sichuanensis]BEL03904.1 hypothetical protein Q0Z83_020950 [Actinoplanes sichuanensis]